MPQCLLVLHALDGLSPAARKAFFDSIYEIAPEHWPVTAGATLVATGISPAYLRDHLLRALAREATPAVPLLVTRIGADLASAGLPAEGAEWLRGVLAEG